MDTSLWSPEDATEYARLQAEAENYDRLQYVYKIKLNSAYGALLNRFFRLYDFRLGSSITATGRMVLEHQARKVSEILDGRYDIVLPLTEEIFNSDPDQYNNSSVIYCDTDSVYFRTRATNAGDAVRIADHLSKLINDSFPLFMRDMFGCTDGFDHRIITGRELVADRGIFVDKKRYTLHVIDLEGKAVDKLKTMGLDIKKTTLPVGVKKELTGFVSDLLAGREWDEIARDVVEFRQRVLRWTDPLALGLPKGINGVVEYTASYAGNNKTRLPGHIAASIYYNQLRDIHGDVTSPAISSGMKIKVFYIKGKHGRFKSIALPGDLEEHDIPSWFTDTIVIDREAHASRLVDKPLLNIIKALNKPVPSIQSTNVVADFIF